MTDAAQRGAPTPPIAARRPERTPRPRRRLGRRLCLDPRRQLARGAARSRGAARRHPRPARSGERLCRFRAGADPRPAAPARARDARAAEGGRQRGSAERRPLRLLFALPPWRPAPHLLPQAARRRQGDGPHRRRRARRGQGVLPPDRSPAGRPTIASSPGAPTTRARRCTRSACATSPARRDLARSRREHHRRSGVDRAIRAASSMSSRTRTIARGG